MSPVNNSVHTPATSVLPKLSGREWLELGFLAFVCICFSSKLAQMVTFSPVGVLGEVRESGRVQMLWLAVYAALGGFVLLRYKTSSLIVRFSPLFLILIGYTVATTAWSIDPGVTMRRTIAVVGTTMLGLYLAGRLTFEEGVKFLAIVYLIMTVVSFCLAVALPGIGRMPAGSGLEGYWSGIQTHKNGLGKVSVMGAMLMTLVALSETGRRRLLFFGGAALAALLVVASRSVTSLLIMFALVGVGWLAHLFQRALALWLLAVYGGAFFFALLIAAALSYGGVEFFLNLLGKDASLTGRLPIWDIVWNSIQERPWLGWGYSAFWNDSGRGHIRLIYEVLGWSSPDAHNGLLELWLNVGLVGIILFCMVFVVGVYKSIVFIRRYRGSILSIVPLLCFFAFGISNITESTVLGRNSLTWVQFSFFIFYLNAYAPALKRGAASSESSFGPLGVRPA